jgi:hypothetical protein
MTQQLAGRACNAAQSCATAFASSGLPSAPLPGEASAGQFEVWPPIRGVMLVSTIARMPPSV